MQGHAAAIRLIFSLCGFAVMLFIETLRPKRSWKDSRIEANSSEKYPVIVREYQTPAGPLRHAIRETGEDPGDGWVIQSDRVPLIEDYNIPRAAEHAVSSPDDVAKIRYLFCPPDEKAKKWFTRRMQRVKEFTAEHSVPVQAWSAFGMDGVVWLTGAESAIMMAMDSSFASGIYQRRKEKHR